MKKRIYLIFLLLGCLSCMEDEKSEKPNSVSDSSIASEEVEVKRDSVFNKERWLVKTGSNYPYRDGMVQDLMTNQGIRNLKYDEIIEHLGKPDRINEGHLYYRIDQTRLGGVWLLHTKTMVIQLAPDSTVNWIKIHE